LFNAAKNSGEVFSVITVFNLQKYLNAHVQRCCCFHLKNLSNDSYWYLKVYQNGTNSSTHLGQPKFDRDEVVSLGGCHFSEQLFYLHLVVQIYQHQFQLIFWQKVWLPQQIKYCCGATESLVESLTSELSSADLLLAYLCSMDDVTYIVLTDTISSVLIRQGKSHL
jgi:hypothetical protein